MRKYLKLLITYLVCLQMFLASTAFALNDVNQISTEEITENDITSLIERLKKFKISTVGKEDCPEDAKAEEDVVEQEDNIYEIDEEFDFFKLQESILNAKQIFIEERQKERQEEIINEKENACSLKTHTIIKKEKDNTCPRIEGFLDKIVKKINSLDEQKKSIESKDLNFTKYKQFANQAINYASLVEEIIYIDDIDEISESLRQELMFTYIENVLWPIREMASIFSGYIQDIDYIDNIYNKLLISFPTILFDEETEERKKLIDGPKPFENPFLLKIMEIDGNKSKISFNNDLAVERDIQNLMKAPTITNYLKSSKWLTTQMMLQQYKIYTAIAGDQKELDRDVIKSCSKKENGGFDGSIELDIYGKDGDQIDGESIMDSILSKHGLILSDLYLDYYHFNIQKDPTKDGYSGLAPFESYKFAKIGYTGKFSSKYLEPALDDINNYNDVINLKIGRALSLFSGGIKNYKTGEITNFEYHGKELVYEILYPPKDEEIFGFIDIDGKAQTISAVENNLSVYLAERMEEEKKTDIKEIIPIYIKNKLQRNKVKIDFPSLYSSSIWRDWGIYKLSEVLFNNRTNKKRKNHIMKLMAKACSQMAYLLPAEKLDAIQQSACQGLGYELNRHERKYGFKYNGSDETYDAFLRELLKLTRFDFNIPGTRIFEDKIEHLWVAFATLWNELRDHTDYLSKATTNEYDYLIKEINKGNPWARSRISYLLAQDELTKKSNEAQKYIGNTRPQNLRECTDKNLCYYLNIKSKLKLIEKAGKTLLLNKIQHPHFASATLKKGEKKYIWKNIMETIDDSTSQLFSQKINQAPLNKKESKSAPKSELLITKILRWGKKKIDNYIKNKSNTNDDFEYYHLIEEISYNNFFTENEVYDFTSNKLDTNLDDIRRDEIASIAESDLGRYGETLRELYDLKGNTQEQQQIWLTFLKENKDLVNENSKEVFLKLDSFLKNTLYKQIMVNSAIKRRALIEAKLSDVCEMELDEHEELQQIYYSTMKAQNRLNKLIGIPGIQNDVVDKMTSMSPEEWKDMKLSLMMMGLMMGSVAFGSACTTLSAGACAPLAVGMVLAAAGGYKIQYDLFIREKDRYVQGNKFAENIKQMEELGFAEKDSSKKMKRSMLWMGLEASGLIAFLGPLVRSTYLGSRFLQIVKTSRHLGKAKFKVLARQAVREADTKMSLDILEFKTPGQKIAFDEYKIDLQHEYQNMQKVFKNYRDQEVSMGTFLRSVNKLTFKIGSLPKYVTKGLKKELFGNVTVDLTIDQIDPRTAKIISRYWNDNPKAFLKHIKSHTNGSFMRKGLFDIEKFLLDETKNTGLRAKYLKLRFKNLLKYSDEIKLLVNKTEKMILDGDNFELFLEENMKMISQIFSKMPIRKRELVHMFLFQGGPHLGGKYLGRRIPVLHEMADTLMMRNYINSRNRLIIETLTRESSKLLGLSTHVANKVTYETMKKFTTNISELKTKQLKYISSEELDVYYEMFQDQVVEITNNTLAKGNLKKKLKNAHPAFNHADLTDNQIKRLLFQMDDLSPEEEALSQLIWNQLPIQEIFTQEELGKLTHELIQELGDYHNVNEFDKYLNALKIQLYNKNELLLEYM